MWRRVGILTDVSEERIASIFRVEEIHERSSETSVNKIPTRRHIPEDGILYQQEGFNRKKQLRQHL
jgi:hypothetical protein